MIWVSSQYSGAKKFDFYQKSNFWVAPPRFIEIIEKILIWPENLCVSVIICVLIREKQTSPTAC